VRAANSMGGGGGGGVQCTHAPFYLPLLPNANSPLVVTQLCTAAGGLVVQGSSSRAAAWRLGGLLRCMRVLGALGCVGWEGGGGDGRPYRRYA
jgi:hypothetical protein